MRRRRRVLRCPGSAWRGTLYVPVPATRLGVASAPMDTWNIHELDVKPHQPEVLRSDDGAARAIVINLPGGEMLQDHEVHEHAWLHVHDGEVEIDLGGQSTSAGPGFVAHFDPHERHEVRAKTDTLLFLLLAPWPGEGRDKDFDA